MYEDDKYVVHGADPLHPLFPIPLGSLIYNSLLNNPNTHDALVDAASKKSISYNELLLRSCSLAKCLQLHGYGKNDVFSISSENNLEFFIPVISALYIGAIIAPVNHSYTVLELNHTLNISKPKIIFCSKHIYKKFIELKSKLSYIEKIIIIDSDDEIHGTESLNGFINKSLNKNPSDYIFKNVEIDPKNHIAAILCSSGTTGLPKGVMLTHYNLLIRYAHTIDPRFHSIEESQLGILPFFHGYGFIVNLSSIISSERIVLLNKFEEKSFLQAIQDYRVVRLPLAPPLMVFLAKSPIMKNYDLTSVKDVISGAAPLDQDIEEILKQRLRLPVIRQGYGLTEATLAVMVRPRAPPKVYKFGSSGIILPYMSCKVRDPQTGKSLGPNQVGEICVKGPMVMKGYYGNEDATKNTFTSDGWLLTGDLGYYDEDKYFFIIDRIKELIKYKGFQVAPAELEALLLTNPEIKDVGVVGLPNEDAGELPLAFVVKVPNSKLTENDVQKFVADRVSSQKHLRGGVIFLTAIPKNPSGKILRRELRTLGEKRKSKL